MRDDDIGIVWNRSPEFVCVFCGMHEPPIAKLQGIRRPKYLQPFNFDRLVFQIGAYLLELLNLFLSVNCWNVVVFSQLESLVGNFIKSEVMITSDDDLMLVRKQV